MLIACSRDHATVEAGATRIPDADNANAVFAVRLLLQAWYPTSGRGAMQPNKPNAANQPNGEPERAAHRDAHDMRDMRDEEQRGRAAKPAGGATDPAKAAEKPTEAMK